MDRMRLVWVGCVIIMMVASLALPTAAGRKNCLCGGTMSLTGPYAEDSAAILAAYEDYANM